VRVLSAPVLNRILEYYKKSDDVRIGYILKNISHLSWFPEQFTIADGLDCLPNIGLGDYENGDTILELLVDQIVFESTSPDLNGPLECTHMCLQTLCSSELTIDSIVDSILGTTDKELLNLRSVLIWALKKAVKARDEVPLPVLEAEPEITAFATIGIRRTEQNISPGRIRSFEFAREVSSKEWEEWSSSVKVLVMGASLRGLGCGSVHGACRPSRDPDGICGWTYSS
jgi:hypothetical protein